jgi:hypothetical protein
MKLKTILIIIIALVILFFTFKRIGLANNISISGIIKPYYEVRQDGNKLYIDTNMIIYVNGEKI